MVLSGGKDSVNLYYTQSFNYQFFIVSLFNENFPTHYPLTLYLIVCFLVKLNTDKMKKLFSLLIVLSVLSCSNDYENDFSRYWEEESVMPENIQGTLTELTDELLIDGINSTYFLESSDHFTIFEFRSEMRTPFTELNGQIFLNNTTGEFSFDQFTINQIPLRN